MRFAVASDHAGYAMKQEVKVCLAELGLDVDDLGAFDETPSDYPDFAEKVGVSLREGRSERGVLICGSGIGVSVAANKMPGVRAGLCHDTYSAHQGVEHDDMNVLVVGARVIGVELAKEIVRAFAAARFSGEQRHRRRLGKVLNLEGRYCGNGKPA